MCGRVVDEGRGNCTIPEGWRDVVWESCYLVWRIIWWLQESWKRCWPLLEWPNIFRQWSRSSSSEKMRSRVTEDRWLTSCTLPNSSTRVIFPCIIFWSVTWNSFSCLIVSALIVSYSSGSCWSWDLSLLRNRCRDESPPLWTLPDLSTELRGGWVVPLY